MKSGFANQVIARGRWILVLAVLLATGTYWFLREPTPEPVIPRAHSSSPDPAAHPPEAPAARGMASVSPEGERERVDPFAPRTWEPPPVIATPVAPLPPPPPQAPPLPFRFFGRIVDPGQPPSFVLTRGTELITVRVGDRIEPSYRVDKFDGTMLHLVYLPLNIHQTLFIGNANE
jgi:hypothetical protein